MHSIKQKRKNYLPSLVLTVLLWLGSGFILLTMPPNSILIIGIFLVFIILAIFLTLSLFLGSSKRGLVLTIGIILLILLKKIDQFTLINISLVIAILITLSMLIKKSTK